MSRERETPRLRLAIAVALAALAFAVHAGVLGHGFVNYDDPAYVTANPRVLAGLAPASIAWAFTNPVDGNWHPVTMFSHLADVEAWGLRPAGHHLTSLALHAANALLLFFLLARIGGDARRAGLAAALFAVHPLNVQSVAWIAERKNVLSTLFWLLALLGWEAYTRRPALGRYLGVLAFTLLALASKPMAVTLPLTLLLVDWLRIEERARKGETRARLALRLVAEKLPFFAASAACGIATLEAQASEGAMQAVEKFPVGVRLANAAVSSVWYLGKMLWPSDLAVFYPHPGASIPAWQVAASLLLLAALTVAAFRAGRFFAVAWTAYLLTLLPILGLIQVGTQAHADRYAYVPLIGPLAAVAFAMPPWRGASSRRAARTAMAAGLAAVAAFGAAAWVQEGYWKDSVTLFERSVAVNPDDLIGQGNLGMALVERGRLDEALPHFQRAAELGPHVASERLNLGNALAMKRRLDEALAEFDAAARLAPADPRAPYGAGRALLAAGRPSAAEPLLREALHRDPQHARAHAALATAMIALGRSDEARREAREALRLAPDDPRVLEEAGRLAR